MKGRLEESSKRRHLAGRVGFERVEKFTDIPSAVSWKFSGDAFHVNYVKAHWGVTAFHVTSGRGGKAVK